MRKNDPRVTKARALVRDLQLKMAKGFSARAIANGAPPASILTPERVRALHDELDAELATKH